MKAQIRKNLIIYGIIMGSFLLTQITLTILFETLKNKINLNNAWISRIFFGILFFLIVILFLHNYYGITKKNKKINEKNILSPLEEKIGFDEMKVNNKAENEKKGYILFNNRRGYYFVLMIIANCLYALILAIIFAIV